MQRDGKKAGRPPGRSDIRNGILRIAQMQFSTRGYDRTTMRSVATEANVNPTLVVHYFSSKHKLFLEAMLRAYQAPAILKSLLENMPQEALGARLAKLVCTIMEDADSRATFLGLLRAACSDAESARILHTFITNELLAQLTQHLSSNEPPLEAALISSEIIGLFVSRYITKVEPIASMSLSELEPKLAAYFQKHAVPTPQIRKAKTKY